VGERITILNSGSARYGWKVVRFLDCTTWGGTAGFASGFSFFILTLGSTDGGLEGCSSGSGS
jgi:6-phosphogluconate dehydrogenase (decarboxylating)